MASKFTNTLLSSQTTHHTNQPNPKQTQAQPRRGNLTNLHPQSRRSQLVTSGETVCPRRQSAPKCRSLCWGPPGVPARCAVRSSPWGVTRTLRGCCRSGKSLQSQRFTPRPSGGDPFRSCAVSVAITGLRPRTRPPYESCQSGKVDSNQILVRRLTSNVSQGQADYSRPCHVEIHASFPSTSRSTQNAGASTSLKSTPPAASARSIRWFASSWATLTSM